MLPIRFYPDTYQEIRESYNWYESKSKGLGEKFLKELEKSFSAIRQTPNTYPMVSKNIRRILVNKFPYGILYKNTLTEIYVVAVMHLKRKPYYWRKQI